MAEQPLATLCAMWERCVRQHIRGLVVVKGSTLRAEQATATLLYHLQEEARSTSSLHAVAPEHLLVHWVANDLPASVPHHTAYYTLQHVHQRQAAQLLGSDTHCVVINGFDRFNLNTLGQVVNTLCGGGLLFLILPEGGGYYGYNDSDNGNDNNNDNESSVSSQCLSPSIRRFYCLLNEFTQKYAEFPLCSFNANEIDQLPSSSEVDSAQNSAPSVNVTLPAILSSPVRDVSLTPNDDQRLVINALQEQLVLDQAYCFLIADRGRGKSTALGMLAKCLADDGEQLVVTASHKRHASRSLSAARQRGVDAQALRFLPVDVLAESLVALDENTILLIDEAASLSAVLLQKLIKRFSRIVFSTTTQGYEGSASGFYSRFRQSLINRQYSVFESRLSAPLRWSSRCQLEHLFAAVLGTGNLIAEIQANAPLQVELSKLTQTDLQNSEALLRQVFNLLSEAHYQTQPSDLQLLLEGDYHLWVVQQGVQLISVLLVFEEGGFDNADATLLQGIIQGVRRPPGNLVAQKLANETGDGAWCSLKSMRVVRIATRDDQRRKGHAGRLIAALEAYAKSQRIDFLSSSFGLNPQLTPFWWQGGFEPAFVGAKLDKASGANNLIVLRPLSESVSVKLSVWQRRWIADLALLAPRFLPELSPQWVQELQHYSSHVELKASESEEIASGMDRPDDIAQLKRFTRNEISLVSVFGALSRWWECVEGSAGVNPEVSQETHAAIAAFVQYAPDWDAINQLLQTAGYKQALARLKAGIQDQLSENN